MTDEEVIATFMDGPKPEATDVFDPQLPPLPISRNGWWLLSSDVDWRTRPQKGVVITCEMSLDVLWEVEEKIRLMSDELAEAYRYEVIADGLRKMSPFDLLHTSSEQRLKALVNIIRPMVEK